MLTGAWTYLAGTCLLATPPPEGQLQRFEFQQYHMGALFNITLYAPDRATANNAADAAYSRVKQLNGIMSDYHPESELNRLCRSSGPGKPVKVSRELLFVLSRSLALSRRSGGAFDVTIGPAVRLWRRARRQRQLPDADRLATARKLVGYRNLALDCRAGTVELLAEGMRLDLGGIAKGYAGDEALSVLCRNGITRALIDAGGDVVAGDPPPGKKGWTVAIASIENPDGPPDRCLLVKNAAVATSGDAFQHIEIDGVRYSHVVDPRTGLGLTRRSNVTVIAPDGLTADSLASAVSVLGPERGLKLIESTCGTAALVVELHDGKPRTFASKRFPTVPTQSVSEKPR